MPPRGRGGRSPPVAEFAENGRGPNSTWIIFSPSWRMYFNQYVIFWPYDGKTVKKMDALTGFSGQDSGLETATSLLFSSRL
jgi:hypothetical protein